MSPLYPLWSAAHATPSGWISGFHNPSLCMRDHWSFLHKETVFCVVHSLFKEFLGRNISGLLKCQTPPLHSAHAVEDSVLIHHMSNVQKMPVLPSECKRHNIHWRHHEAEDKQSESAHGVPRKHEPMSYLLQLSEGAIQYSCLIHPWVTPDAGYHSSASIPDSIHHTQKIPTPNGLPRAPLPSCSAHQIFIYSYIHIFIYSYLSELGHRATGGRPITLKFKKSGDRATGDQSPYRHSLILDEK